VSLEIGKTKKHSMNKAAISNPALQSFAVLVGEWETVGTHPLVPNTTLHGHSSFKWIEGGAFLMWSSQIDKEGFPAGIAIFGSDDAAGEYFMMYFDERKVSRKYEVSLQDGILKWWRNAPGFSQQYTWTITNNGDTIVSKGQLSKDGTTWEKDLEITFTRIK
jgi:hypothetical protein